MLVSVMLIFCLSACNNPKFSNKRSGQIKSIVLDELIANDLDIDNFEIETTQRVLSGKRGYATDFVNNSKYDIIAFEITFTPKSGVTDEELALFDPFLSEHSDWIDDVDKQLIILRGSYEGFISNGQSAENIPVTMGYDNNSWYDSPNEQQYNIMSPSLYAYCCRIK